MNGNGRLEWEEFTNYIIEKATVLNNIKSKQDEIKLYTRSNMKTEKKFLQMITKVIYIKEIDRIAFFEDGSDEIQFMTPEGAGGFKPLKIIPISDKVQTTTVKKDKEKMNVASLHIPSLKSRRRKSPSQKGPRSSPFFTSTTQSTKYYSPPRTMAT